MWGTVAGAIAVLAVFVSSAAAAQVECAKPDALGVSRTVEVDTTNGPWFGEPHGNPDFLKRGEVVLTFDDGPAPASTRPILQALAAQCTKATFFMVGEMVAAHPETVREVAAAGHTIGTHTWSHANLRRMSPDAFKAQIESTFTAAERAAGVAIAPFFRYPYLDYSAATVAYLRSRNIAQFAIDIDSLDWRDHNAQSVIRRIMARLASRGRGIILMHDIHPTTAAAVPELLARLKAGGYSVVHLVPKAPATTIAAYQPPSRQIRRARRPLQIAHHVSARRAAVRPKAQPTDATWWTW
jgi:peptidoglycan/xylan/chitin deacetylase (PgdA/CDA1 family)